VRRTRPAPKVIVLDCDGTLWDGVVADDGVGALQAGDAFPGFAYRSFQYALRRLRHDGVLLALASKNDAEHVVRAFAEVDGMVLTDDDIVARRVSWDPKPEGVADIAAELNLGLDAFVFVDDSDYEVGAMRLQYPMVRTLRVPEQIEELPDLLAETGWFRAMRVTADDRERTERMIAEAGRATVASSMSHDEFLAALDLRVRVVEAGVAEVGRVTQLINKTNQFNVTTRRRSEAEVTQLIASDDSAVFAVSAADRFGDYGTVGVLIGVSDPGGWELDTVLMSCRVLGRGVETAMLAGAIAGLRSKRPGRVIASYVDSGRNALVADLFADHGFAPLGDGRFELEADQSVAVPPHITLQLS
jgi:FkbH-like protein